jgi:hypothetical protein
MRSLLFNHTHRATNLNPHSKDASPQQEENNKAQQQQQQQDPFWPNVEYRS